MNRLKSPVYLIFYGGFIILLAGAGTMFLSQWLGDRYYWFRLGRITAIVGIAITSLPTAVAFIVVWLERRKIERRNHWIDLIMILMVCLVFAIWWLSQK